MTGPENKNLHDELAAWAESDAPWEAPGRELHGDAAAEAGRAAIRRAGRPSLSGTTGGGRSPRRQVRLDAATNARLDAYATATGKTPSDVIREALTAYLTSGAA